MAPTNTTHLSRLGLALWRPVVPSHPDDEGGRYFSTIAVGIRGYFDERSDQFRGRAALTVMSRPKRKTLIALSVGSVLICSAVLYGYSRVTEPLRYPIFLEPAGFTGRDDLVRDVCAEWSGSPDQWWIAVEKDSPVYAEIRSAKRLQFETDIGSGLSNVCLGEELDFKTRPDLVKAVLASCDRGGWHAKPKYERHVVLQLAPCPAIPDPFDGES